MGADLRYSPSPCVNLAKGAKGVSFHSPGLVELCEKVIATYEEECAKFSPQTFQERLYLSYFREKGGRNLASVLEFGVTIDMALYAGKAWKIQTIIKKG